MFKPHLLLPLLSLPQAMSYELRAGWLPRWLPERWLLAWYGRKTHRKYGRYLRTLPPADQKYLIDLNRKLLRPATTCAKKSDP